MKSKQKHLSSNHGEKNIVFWHQHFHQIQINVNSINMIVNIKWYQKIEHTIHQKISSKKDYNSTNSDVKVNKVNWKNNGNPGSSNPLRKKTVMLGDTIVNQADA